MNKNEPLELSIDNTCSGGTGHSRVATNLALSAL